MTSPVSRLRGSPRVQHQLTHVRNLRNRWIDQPLKQLEHARRALVNDEADVLVLGDSSFISWSFRDADRTLIPELIGRKLDARLVTIAGPAFGPRLYAELLRILETLEQRPRAVVVALNLRTSYGTHTIRHPLFNYDRTLAAMAEVTSARRRIRSFGVGGVVDIPAEREAYLTLPITTRWGGTMTLGDYRKRVQVGQPPWPRETEAFRFDYVHGELFPEDHPCVPDVVELGRRLESYGVPVVVNWTHPPMQRGELHYPGEFEAHVRGNFATLQSALSTGGPGLAPILDVPIADEEYEDSQNAVEHYAIAGRIAIANAIVDALPSL